VDPGWKKIGSGIRDGKKSDPGSGIKTSRIRNTGWIHVDANLATTTKTDNPITLQYNKRNSKDSAGYTVWIMGVRTRIQTTVIMTKIVKLKKILTKNAIYVIYFKLNS
jgi:hypothetical protein